jgi:menaquinone-dependent protoporphyrinogen oxidase
MPASVLIAYATRGGSTCEVAQTLGAAFQEADMSSQILSVEQVRSIPTGTILVLGAPLYMGRFPKEFYRFLHAHHADLAASQCWCFVLGPTRTEPADFAAAKQQALRQFARFGWFHPVEIQVFGGRWNVATLSFPFSLARYLPMNPLGKIPPSDIRDWPAIRAWAQGIAGQIGTAA